MVAVSSLTHNLFPLIIQMGTKDELSQEENDLIIDRIEEQERYYGIHPHIEEAFAFLAESPDLECGLYELDYGMYARVKEGKTGHVDSVDLEAHHKYIDLQYCISGGERICWAHIIEVNKTGEDPQKDNYYYKGNSASISVRPGMFYIMFPSDAHKTARYHEFPRSYRKVVIKIPVQNQDD